MNRENVKIIIPLIFILFSITLFSFRIEAQDIKQSVGSVDETAKNSSSVKAEDNTPKESYAMKLYKKRIGKSTMILGWSLWSVFYLVPSLFVISVYAASNGLCSGLEPGEKCPHDNLDKFVFLSPVIPLIGPFIFLSSFEGKLDNGSSFALFTTFLIEGILQNVFFTGGVIGTVLYMKYKKILSYSSLKFNEAKKQQRIFPFLITIREGIGIGIRGVF